MRIFKFILASLVVLGASVSMADQVCTHNLQVGLNDSTKSGSIAAAPVLAPALPGSTSPGDQ